MTPGLLNKSRQPFDAADVSMALVDMLAECELSWYWRERIARALEANMRAAKSLNAEVDTTRQMRAAQCQNSLGETTEVAKP